MAVSGGAFGVCAQIRSALPALVGDDEPSVERPVVLAHLRACPKCRREYGAYLRAERALRRLAVLPEPRPGFFADLERETLAALPAPARPRLVGWWVAVACFLGGVAVPILWHWPHGPADVGASLQRMPALASGAVATAPSGRLQPVSLDSRHRGLLGQRRIDHTQWGDSAAARIK